MAKGRKRAVAKVSASLGKKLPTLTDLRKTVPKGGLLNPGLRKGAGLGIGLKK